MTDYHEPSVGDEIHVSADELRQRLGDGDWSMISTAELRALRAREGELRALRKEEADLRARLSNVRAAAAGFQIAQSTAESAEIIKLRSDAGRLRAERDEAREERDGLAEIAIAVRDALPTLRAGLDAGGGHAPEAVRARIAAVDAVHALADALEGEAPAAVLSAAELEVVRGVLRQAQWAVYCTCEGGECRRDLRDRVDAWLDAGRPLAGEESEG